MFRSGSDLMGNGRESIETLPERARKKVIDLLVDGKLGL
jgi:predicted DNA-binding protein (UPF0251 family)